MLRAWLLNFGNVGLAVAVLGVAAGPFVAQTTGGTGPDWATGGIVSAAIATVGGVVRYMGGLVEKERLRGDRLELALIDKAVTAMGSSSSAQAELSRTVQDLVREVREIRDPRR